jgi:hypothetical protein
MTGRELGFVATRWLALYALVIGIEQGATALTMGRTTMFEHGQVTARIDYGLGSRIGSLVELAIYVIVAIVLWRNADAISRRLSDTSPAASSAGATDWRTLGMRLIGVLVLVNGTIDIVASVPLLLVTLRYPAHDLFETARMLGNGLSGIVRLAIGYWLTCRMPPVAGSGTPPQASAAVDAE